MRKRVFEVIERTTEDGEVIEEYIELKLVEVIEHKPEPELLGGESIGRFINVMV